MGRGAFELGLRDGVLLDGLQILAVLSRRGHIEASIKRELCYRLLDMATVIRVLLNIILLELVLVGCDERKERFCPQH